VSYYAYCIFRGPLPAALEMPDGVSGYRVFTVNYRGLGAALSKVGESNAPPDSSNRVARERVVESFYRHLTVIPMRSGCQVGCPYDAVVLLQDNYDVYGELLRQLEGLAEVGMQVVFGDSGPEAESRRARVLPDWLPLHTSPLGAAYVKAKNLCSPRAEREDFRENALIENLCKSLHGSYVRHKVEFPSSGKNGHLSLRFLVPRDSVDNFRSAAHQLPGNPPVKLLLSGPWPPYNFVDASQPQEAAATGVRAARCRLFRIGTNEVPAASGRR